LRLAEGSEAVHCQGRSQDRLDPNPKFHRRCWSPKPVYDGG
jgi:hypothetical protein